MTNFETKNYKTYMKKWLEQQPRKGRGLLSRLAETTGLSPAMISQVLNGDKDFSPETANDVAAFMALTEAETEFFLLLVNFARAGTYSLKERLKRKVEEEQRRANKLSEKYKATDEIPEVAKAIFYSHWIYTAIVNMSACEEFATVDKIAQHLKLPRASVQKAVDFLIQYKMCAMKGGRLTYVTQFTFIGKETSLVEKHAQNWRLLSMSKMFEPSERNFFFTSPMSMSREVAEIIRFKLPALIEEVRALVGPSDSEVVRCLNIDWFEY